MICGCKDKPVEEDPNNDPAQIIFILLCSSHKYLRSLISLSDTCISSINNIESSISKSKLISVFNFINLSLEDNVELYSSTISSL